jgi:hypothetical protein
MKRLWFLLLIPFLLAGGQAWAACSWSGNTGTVASPYAVTDVAACVTDASSKTGAVIIHIPNSSVTWSSVLTVNMRSGFTNVTSLTMRGQNDCTTNTTTEMVPSAMNFQYPTSCSTVITNLLLNYSGIDGKAFRFSNIQAQGDCYVIIEGDSKTWRFDHLFFSNVTGAASGRLFWYDKKGDFGVSPTWSWLTEGLVDHNNAVFSAGAQFFFSQIIGNAEWIAPHGLGTSSAIFVENNRVIYPVNAYFIDNNGGARYVIRFNYVANGIGAGHDLEMPRNGFRGSRKQELYGNRWDSDKEIFYWGGNGVIFNNTLTKDCSGWDVFFRIIRLTSEFPTCAVNSGNNIFASASLYPVNAWNCVIGVDPGCAKADGNSVSPTGYPCRDQLGVASEGVDGNLTQTAAGKPVYVWGNTRQGGAITFNIESAYHVENQDYYKSPSTVSGGVQTAGVGSGIKANMPAACTNKTSYWVTDEGYWNSMTPGVASGVLYQCQSGTFKPYYVPYPFPHPLQSGLAAPTGLTVK